MVDNQDDYLVVNIIENFLGQPKSSKDAEKRTQWEFNCPSKTCRQDSGKFNLTYQSHRKVFNCWKCKYRGVIYRLVRDFGGKDNLKRLKLILPEYSNQSFNIFKKPELDYDLITCDLPDGYLPLNKKRQSTLYNLAWDYAVNQRKISPTQIDKHQIGYTEIGSRKLRIIIPSFNSDGKINYFEARSYLKGSSMPYYKPNFPNKKDIIFNEKFINWDLPVYLVEGIFDALSIDGVAVMHDDINSDQALLLSTLNKQIILVPDRDKTGLALCDRALELGYSVSLPNWDDDVKDVNDAVVKYGKLPTLLSILQCATNSKIKIEMQRKKIGKART